MPSITVIRRRARRRGQNEENPESKVVARNYQIMTVLQTQVEGRLAVRPGVYDGRKNMFTSFDLEFESGSQEVSLLYHCSSPCLTCSLFSST
jgi:hypothetical protein